ncbi:hypothetical protein ALT717_220034 [Alteromonas macleodii]
MKERSRSYQSGAYNKKIKSPASAGWNAYTWAASHYSPHASAP